MFDRRLLFNGVLTDGSSDTLSRATSVDKPFARHVVLPCETADFTSSNASSNMRQRIWRAAKSMLAQRMTGSMQAKRARKD
jgi:hypothetical protein